MPHVRSSFWYQQTDAVVFLQYDEDGGALRIGSRNALRIFCPGFVTLGLIRRIELQLKTSGWEELGYPSEIGKLQQRLDFTQRDEAIHIGLEHRSLPP